MSASLLEKLLCIIADLTALMLAFIVLFWIQYQSGWVPEKVDLGKDLSNFIRPGIYLNISWLGLFTLTGLYRKWMVRSRIFEIWCVLRSVLVGWFLIFCLFFGLTIVGNIYKSEPIAFLNDPFFKVLVYYFFLLITLLIVFRMAVQFIVRFLLLRGFGTDKFIIIGVNEAGALAKKELEENPELGHRLVGFVNSNTNSEENDLEDFQGAKVLGRVENLKAIAKENKAAGIVITHETKDHEDILEILKHVAELPITVYVIPDLYDVVMGYFKISFVHGFNLKELLPHNMPPWEAYLKRLMDIIISFIGLIVASPILLLTSIIVKLDSKGPVFYSQERVGQYGYKFYVHKFRSMRTDAEKDGPQWATKKDPRITRIGKFLRKTRIDEIPQLWCVFVGDMSMVGPRPEREHFINQLKEEIPLYGRRLLMKPGLTGWAQVRHHYDTSIDDVKKKLLYDLYYFENMSVFLDIQILIRTIWVVITGSGAQ